ncbi:hypothetical protein AMAG_12701 [Allomyces macrogynus ATCC 38327]|uniref:SPX domain-containing protein n=1 Tax=Allomyces macrogynus (strain ATCC 38327) TaxID=578462 RepID=A0A0L0T1D3_ALLM3|nr:hypothetical protein AMAG_12701 [Allomyces macrogynus ATCC 38327]|eukprot:KNE68532.1 hypothetical protein AMAG_12701 [Allomyces macrogynus ATCC 38327]
MKFGKQIQNQAITEWSQYYINYKALKKVINSLEKSQLHDGTRPNGGSTATASAHSITIAASPVLVDSEPPSFTDAHTDPIQAHKAAFFYKLERELDRVNAFYLTKETDLKVRLRSLLEKKRLAQGSQAVRGTHAAKNHGANLRTIQEALWQLQQDLTKLQQFVALNAEGFRKILKKWDKRSKSSTKELYLSRQVEVQPCFNRDTLTELTDIVSTHLAELSLMDLAAVASPAPGPVLGTGATTALARSDSLDDLESDLAHVVKAGATDRLRDTLARLRTASPAQATTAVVSRVLVRACRQGGSKAADAVAVLVESGLADVHYRDEINDRTALHAAALAGDVAIVRTLLAAGADGAARDVYGRTPLHYASMHGFTEVAVLVGDLDRVPAKDADNPAEEDDDRSVCVAPDHDGFSPLIYAIIGGFTAIVAKLLEQYPQLLQTTVPHHVLSLAAQYGHVDIATLLLAKGAPIAPEEGLHPLHITAKQGHVTLTKLLCDHVASVDISDKYYNWTPLFYAASEGHQDCVEVLLEYGASTNLVDETGWTVLTHTLYRGHIAIAVVLWEHMQRHKALHPPSATASPALFLAATATPAAIQPIAPSGLLRPRTNTAPALPAAADDADGDPMDLDAIPSLALPPPIIPFRIYGHTYLESKYQVQIAVPMAPVLYAQKLASLRVVLAAKPDPGAVPHTLILPADDEREAVAFQAASLDVFSLHIDVFPTYGTRPIARAAVLARDLVRARHGETLGADPSSHAPTHGRVVVPLFDAMNVVGELTLDYALIAPFNHPKLAVGGPIATYWKTTQVVSAAAAAGAATAAAAGARPTGLLAHPHGVSSLMPSPTLPSGGPTTPSGIIPAAHGTVASLITASSLAQKYVHVVVQLTVDLVPVLFPTWHVTVPLGPDGAGIQVPVAQLTHAQFQVVGRADPRRVDLASVGLAPSSATLARALRHAYLSLGEALDALPSDTALFVELKYPTALDAARHRLPCTATVDVFVDKVLTAVYDRAAPRALVFASFNPLACNAVNWKQPNYPVFFNTWAGYPSEAADGGTALLGIDAAPTVLDADAVVPDARCASIKEAIRFTKHNNLLGVVCFARPLIQVPALIQAVKEAGLILATFGAENAVSQHVLAQEKHGVDGVYADGVVRFTTSAAGVI